jgi:hypothetical protein
MKAVMIRDMEPQDRFLAVDLRHVLTALGQRALVSEWRVRDVWATGDATPTLEGLDEAQVVSGQRLFELAQNVVQIIDGVFSGYEPGTSSPWVIVEARDSSYYAVHSDEPAVLAHIQKTFQKVTPYEYEVA